MVRLEICIDGVAGAAAAIEGGADRLELCGALSVGGLTPSAGLVDEVLRHARAAAIPVHAMVRPRAGDFAYDADELATAIAEGRALLAAGVDGLVFGACRGGVLDDVALRRWMDDVGHNAGARVLHRAIDLVDDPVAAVDTAVALGFTHILSSGGAMHAPDAAAVLRAMIARAARRLTVIAGAGIRPGNAAALLRDTRAREIHASASVPRGRGDPRAARRGFAVEGLARTDARTVRALRASIDGGHV